MDVRDELRTEQRLSVFKADKKAIFTAASKASEAAAFLAGFHGEYRPPTLSGRASTDPCTVLPIELLHDRWPPNAQKRLFSALLPRPCFSDRLVTRRPQGLRSSSGPFENRRQASNLSTLPASTDAAFAVKTERLPPYGLPPITTRR